MSESGASPRGQSPRARFCRKSLLLYAVTDRAWLFGRTLDSAVRDALSGGATFVQLREKSLCGIALREEALLIQKACAEYGAPFVINDDVFLARKIGADGAHIGQGDLDARKARAVLGDDKILGVSVRTAREAEKAALDGADYLGAGAVFPTGTKSDAVPVPFETLREICRAVSIPVVAIGGIGLDNMSGLCGSGICGIAAVSAIFAQEDVRAAAASLRLESERLFSSKGAL